MSTRINTISKIVPRVMVSASLESHCGQLDPRENTGRLIAAPRVLNGSPLGDLERFRTAYETSVSPVSHSSDPTLTSMTNRSANRRTWCRWLSYAHEADAGATRV